MERRTVFSAPNALVVTLDGGGSAYAYKQYRSGYTTYTLRVRLQLGAAFTVPHNDALVLAQTVPRTSSKVGKVDVTIPADNRIRLDYFDSAGHQHHLWGRFAVPRGSWHMVKLPVKLPVFLPIFPGHGARGGADWRVGRYPEKVAATHGVGMLLPLCAHPGCGEQQGKPATTGDVVRRSLCVQCHWAMSQSIRAQLTVWLALLITLCLAAFAFYLYVAVSHSLTADLDQTLRVQAQQITATYEFTEPHDRDYKEDVEENQQLVDTSVGSPRAASRVWAEVLDTRGHLLTHSSNLGPRHLPLPAQAWALLHAGPRLSMQAVPGGALHVYSLPAMDHDGQTVGLVVVAASLQAVRATAQILLVLLLAGGQGSTRVDAET